jgi:hypothetical protein
MAPRAVSAVALSDEDDESARACLGLSGAAAGKPYPPPPSIAALRNRLHVAIIMA